MTTNTPTPPHQNTTALAVDPADEADASPTLDALHPGHRAIHIEAVRAVLDRDMGYMSGPQAEDPSATVNIDGFVSIAYLVETVLVTQAKIAAGECTCGGRLGMPCIANPHRTADVTGIGPAPSRRLPDGTWPDAPPAPESIGWGYIRPGDRRAHAYEGGMSLCGKVGFYNAPLEPLDTKPSPDDCAACRKRVDRRLADQA